VACGRIGELIICIKWQQRLYITFVPVYNTHDVGIETAVKIEIIVLCVIGVHSF